MKQKLLFFLLALLSTMTAWAEVGDEFTVDGLIYRVMSENPKEVAVKTYDGEKPSGDLVIPASVNGYAVTETTLRSFRSCTGLTSVAFPASMTSIDCRGFYGCTSLTSITVDADNANYSSKDGVVYDKAGTTLILCPTGRADYPFSIPDGVTTISGYAFYGCTLLPSIIIPASVTTIEQNAFSGIQQLYNIHCKADLQNLIWADTKSFASSSQKPYCYVEGEAWEWEEKFPDVNVSFKGSGLSVGDRFAMDNLIYEVTNGKDKTVKLVGSQREKEEVYALEIPAVVSYNESQNYTVTSIGEWAFSGCSGLTSIEIPNSVTVIGDRAFYCCFGLTSVTIGNGVTSIGEWAFWGCSGLTSIEIPNSVTSIGRYAFEDCSGLTSITIGNGVTSIDNFAFEGCSSLTNLEIPNSVITIGGDAFKNCSGLTSITIGNSVTSIGNGAFAGCSGLTSLEIPNSVTSIGNGAFTGCIGLISIVVADGNTEYDSRDNCNAIIETQTNTLIKGCYNTIIPNDVASIGQSAFSGCSGLTNIEIPSSVTDIGMSAFNGCSGLTSIEIPSGVTTIGPGAFYDCSGLTSIEIPGNVIYILGSAFYGCTSITNVYCYANPEMLTWIGYDTGFMPEKATKFHVADASVWEEKFPDVNVTFVGDLDDFFVEDNLRYKKIRQTETRASIRKAEGQNVVELVGCVTAPTGAVDIPASVKHDGVDYAVTSIGENAFTNCSGMTSVTIPSSVTNIEDGAFDGCI